MDQMFCDTKLLICTHTSSLIESLIIFVTYQGLQDWMSELLTVAHELREQPQVCKLVGFYGEDGCLEHMLVYEKLKRGSLSKILFEEGSDALPLDWSMRMKIAYGAAEGLAIIHERFPDKVSMRETFLY